MPIKKDLTGQRFGRLVVIEEVKKRKNGRILWKCNCDCGNTKEIYGNALLRGSTKSCGCLHTEIVSERFRKYDKDTTNLRNVLQSMKQRCLNPNNTDYYLYGGRGITICNEWLDKNIGMENFVNWSIKNGYKPGLSIDRIDNDKGYSPDNCRWVDSIAQGRNKRTNHIITFKGETHCLSEWAELMGLPYSVLKNRINRYGWNIEEALTIPIGGKR